ncbi:low-density lipoprotein receptor-related protein 6-like [Mizuhopecten yessoensis]|uniref:low-density lipoprotein receptor-related protein 6-like n=1 Tax=Mizuhopecten yessoensis TaxID=6573 RepID=UPI000B4597A5|nr:low-density lipoprotein receptor-related protein 6-like [Mizuhopecten yessoensis]
MASIDINSMDVNIAEGTVYFLDRETECIYRLSIDTNNVTTVRCGVSRSVYSTIAYDWISRNMYWTDGFFKWIAVQPADTTDRSMYKVIIENDIEKPRALAVDPIAGFIFWFDINPSGYRIERASLDGSDRTRVITRSLLSVHDIETDPVNSRIYWTDARKYTIESSKYDGSDRRIIYKRINMFFRSISIDMDYVCATIFDEQSWRCIHKSTGDVKLTRFSEFSTSNPKLISIYKQELKPTMTDNCPMLGCEHFCVKLSSISACMCKEGYTMDTAGVCNGRNYFHIFAAVHMNNHLYGKGVFLCNATNICMFDYRASAGHTEPLLCLSSIGQVCRHLAVAASTGTIFYADSVANTINGYDLTTNVIGPLTAASNVSGLTFDWTDGHIYWTEATSGQVKALSLQTNAVMVISQTTSLPSLVTVDPHSRSLFWVEDTGGSSMQIMFKSLTDSSSAQVLKQFKTSSIRSLFYDITSNRLFYVDDNTLNTTTRNGSYSTSFPFNVDNVNQMVIYKTYVIWFSDTGYLNSISTHFFQKQQTSLPMTFGTVTGMAVYDPNLQHSSISPCRYMNGGCEHMCFTGLTGAVVCSCSYGFILQPDQKSCSSVYQSENFILAPDFANGIIYQVSTVDASVIALDITTAQRPLSVVYKRTSSYVYWADIREGQIMRASIDGTNEQVVFTSEGADSYPTFLALDSSTGNVYASIKNGVNSPNTGSIIVLQPSTRRFKTIVEDLQTVNGLALFPSKGIMFYMNGNGSASFIERASMDGTNPRAIVTLPNDGYTILTIDYVNILCEDGVTNGVFSSPCGSLVQEACMFQCYPGFISAIPNSTLTCREDGQWSGDPQTVCENKCLAPSESDNGRLWTSCHRAINETCQYDCFAGYTKNFDVITCTEGNTWSPALADMCSIDEGIVVQLD